MSSNITTYAEAEAFFAARINRSRTYLGSVRAVRLPETGTVLRKTWDHERSQYGYAVRYHDTDVVTYWEDGTVAVATGGWLTVTTVARMQQFLPAVFSFEAKVYYKDQARRSVTVYGPYNQTEFFFPAQTGTRRFAF